MEIIIKDNKLTEEILKKAIIGLLKEKNELLIQVIKEAIEEFALGEAIKEGLNTENVSKEEIFNILKN